LLKRLKGKDFKGKELKVEFGRGERKTEDRRSYLFVYQGINAIFATKKDILPNNADTTALLEVQAMVTFSLNRRQKQER